MKTPEEQRADTLLNIIIDLTQQANVLKAERDQYKEWWLEDSKALSEVTKELNAIKDAKTCIKPECGI